MKKQCHAIQACLYGIAALSGKSRTSPWAVQIVGCRQVHGKCLNLHILQPLRVSTNAVCQAAGHWRWQHIRRVPISAEALVTTSAAQCRQVAAGFTTFVACCPLVPVQP